VTDSASVNADCDNAITLRGTRVYRRACARATHRIAREAREETKKPSESCPGISRAARGSQV
jgi:hypothetical protein